MNEAGVNALCLAFLFLTCLLPVSTSASPEGWLLGENEDMTPLTAIQGSLSPGVREAQQESPETPRSTVGATDGLKRHAGLQPPCGGDGEGKGGISGQVLHV